MGAFMKNNEHWKDGQATETETGGRGKKPYQKPARRREKVFETTAIACGKVGGTQGPCNSNKKNS